MWVNWTVKDHLTTEHKQNDWNSFQLVKTTLKPYNLKNTTNHHAAMERTAWGWVKTQTQLLELNLWRPPSNLTSNISTLQPWRELLAGWACWVTILHITHIKPYHYITTLQPSRSPCSHGEECLRDGHGRQPGARQGQNTNLVFSWTGWWLRLMIMMMVEINDDEWWCLRSWW